jgi:hypothetical protein
MRPRNVVIFASILGVIFLSLALLLLGPSAGPTLPTERARLIDFLHPLYSIPAMILVILAYLFKKMGRERFLAHYLAGTFAVSLTIIAVYVGLDVVSTYPNRGANHFLFTLPYHFLVAIFVVSLVGVQGYIGFSMLLFGRTRRRISIHRRLSKWVFVIYLLQGALGLSILLSLLYQLVR